MATQDHKGQVLAHYRAIRIEAEARPTWTPEPLEVVTKRIKAMVDEYLMGYQGQRLGRTRWQG